MRGTVARQLRRTVKSAFRLRPWVEYEVKPFMHGGQERDGTTVTLTPDCQRYEYQILKARW